MNDDCDLNGFENKPPVRRWKADEELEEEQALPAAAAPVVVLVIVVAVGVVVVVVVFDFVVFDLFVLFVVGATNEAPCWPC